MSGFAVLLADGEPFPPGDVGQVAAAIAPRGRDRESSRTVGRCTLLHSALWTTPEAAREQQPQRHPGRDLWLTADARIDNRAELRARLERGVEQALDTDADLILAAYEHWGAGCFEHLVGDFALALWDAERDELILARDAFGLRPLYWADTGSGLVAASALSAVLKVATIAEVDEDYLAGFLIDEPPVDGTIWCGIHRLPPGHLLRLGAAGPVVERWWNPSIEPLALSIDEAVTRVRDCFDEAVRSRLRCRDGIAVELSGGLDSSTVAATAVGLGATMSALTCAFDDAEADELDHAAAVAAHLGLDVEVLPVEAIPPFDVATDVAAQQQPLYSIDAADTASRHAAARALGCSVVLSGVGGDEALYGSSLAPLDLALSGHLGGGFRWLRRDGLTRPAALWRLVRGFARQAALGRVRRHPEGMVARRMAARWERRRAGDHPWLRSPLPALAERPDRTGPLAKQEQRDYYVATPYNPIAYEQTDRLAAERHVEVRYPFLDRRLVELVLRLPEDLIRLGGERRGLHRRAFGDRLPQSVATRTDKAELTRPFIRKMFAAFDRSAAERALSALDDRIDAAAFLRTYDAGERSFDRAPGEPQGFQLWLALSAGLTVKTCLIDRSRNA
ncbi:asparagine synthetase B family protein [Aeromicrobium ginsengisoli]|uniref:asparagine synthase (glutamine-hydrolyzing) n=1 Tax=Aeromicrobium ginsengisoli TaxID=363867 RepID=A0A5M4FA22_9ACTN|nr:asparagine synthase-related protein [Aeromicrobium ginsengisoli]KAA1395194.1 hypothetical protein ESP70_013545 [Aeromicrobium ginsengisoli]